MNGSLVDYDFNVHVGGLTDGPSAGMLTTVSMIALMRGATPRADTTMTGTINPDGTAGPVTGIVQKMQGAREAGLKRFGFPIGTRTHKDLKTGETVDLLTVAQKLGLEARELSDLYEAYSFMTTDKLPRVEPIAKQAVRFQGSLRVFKNWALFLGSTVDGNGQSIKLPPMDNDDTVALWLRTRRGWQLIDSNTGHSDAFYIIWPEQYGVPKELVGLE